MNYKKFVINAGRWLIDSATAFDFAIVSLLTIISLFLIISSFDGNPDNFFTGLIVFLSALVFLVVSVVVKFVIYLLININDNLEIMAKNTQVTRDKNINKTIENEDSVNNLTETDNNAFLNKGIYKK